MTPAVVSAVDFYSAADRVFRFSRVCLVLLGRDPLLRGVRGFVREGDDEQGELAKAEPADGFGG